MPLSTEQLRAIIRELIQQELDESTVTGDIDGGAGPPKTPYAFVTRKKKKKKAGYSGGHKKPEILGLTLAKDPKLRGGTEGKTVGKRYQKEMNEITTTIRTKDGKLHHYPNISKDKVIKFLTNNGMIYTPTQGKLKTNKHFSIMESKYTDYRNDEEFTPKQKIGLSIRNVRNTLLELEKEIRFAARLKSETNTASSDYWKNTHKAMAKIDEKMKKISQKMKDLL